MFGHRVFRHRIFGLSDPMICGLQCQHEGKAIGHRGVARKDAYGKDRWREYSGPSNMFGPYSWQSGLRGSLEQLTTAMGHTPGSFSYRGLTQGLPMGYGRFISSGLVALSLAANLGMPYMGAAEFKDQCGSTEALTTWAERGYHPRGTLTWIDPDLATASQPLMAIAEVDHPNGATGDDPARVTPSQPRMIITERRAAVVIQRRYRGTHSSSPPVASPTKSQAPLPG